MVIVVLATTVQLGPTLPHKIHAPHQHTRHHQVSPLYLPVCSARLVHTVSAVPHLLFRAQSIPTHQLALRHAPHALLVMSALPRALHHQRIV